jgi:hypothetical protein
MRQSQLGIDLKEKKEEARHAIVCLLYTSTHGAHTHIKVL